jgi:spore coat polysaccharide biosynthesis protein SpsF (cytidylyltransferase family)
MGSSRLPGKVLRPANGKPMLQYLLESLSMAGLGRLVVVTSGLPTDDGIAALCEARGVACVRGDEEDVASRFEAAIRRFGFHTFVRTCGDSPLMDPDLIRRGLEEYAAGDWDLVTNTRPRSFPKGQSVEVVRSRAFLEARPRFSEPGDREHVTRYFYRNPGEFRISNFSCDRDWGAVQLSVDTAEDFRRFEALASAAKRPHWEYRWMDWVALAGEGAAP